MKGKIIYLFLFIGILLVFGCKESEHNETEQERPEITEEMLLKANKKFAQSEAELIKDYTARHKLNVISTQSGLYYQIYKDVEGKTIVNNDIVDIKFTLSLINGQRVYSSKDNGLKQFLVGNDDVENGLHEAVKLLNKGDKAIIIIPSHLAFGLAGDDDRIPKKATLIYDLEVIEVIQ